MGEQVEERVHVYGAYIENTMGISLCEVSFEQGAVTIVAGKNASGKTSLIKSLWFALAGKPGESMPIKDGAESGLVKVMVESKRLGKLVITRTFGFKKPKEGEEPNQEVTTTLTVKGADGASYAKAQSLLDALFNEISIDPTGVLHMTGKERREMLLAVVNIGIDLTRHAAQVKGIYDDRTLNNRAIRTLKGKVDGVSFEGVPDEEVSVTGLADELTEAQNHNQCEAQYRDNIDSLLTDIQNGDQEVAEYKDKIKMILGHTEVKSKALSEYKIKLDNFKPIDTAKLREDMVNAENINRRVAEKRGHNEHLAELKLLEEGTKKYTTQLNSLEKDKNLALEKAEFPIEHLAIDEGDITFEGIPFDQINTASQINVALSIQAALNPALRFITCDHGSECDDETIELIAKWANENDFSVILTMVRTDNPAAIVMSDGKVLSKETPSLGLEAE